MSITDELRKLTKNSTLSSWTVEYLTAIADRIDAEHQKAIQELNNLADASVLLPVDADGVPIRVGDKVYQVGGGWVYTVKSITLYPDNTTVTFECEHGFGSDSAHNVRHYHEPTVEDLLREFAEKMNENIGMYTSEAIDADEWRDADNKTIAEYAAKLRLAENGEDE